MMKSLDPRVNRLPQPGDESENSAKPLLDQLSTFEVFVQAKEGKPFQHEGIVHASDPEMAYVLAKETFTRRFTCCAIAVTDTRNVVSSPVTDGNVNAYDTLAQHVTEGEKTETYEIFHLMKRGKQYLHAGTVEATHPTEAFMVARQNLQKDKMVYGIWAIRTADLRFTTLEEKDLWLTLPEKKFRDAADYKGGDKLKAFLEKMNN